MRGDENDRKITSNFLKGPSMPRQARRKVRERPATCDRFDWTCGLEGPELVIRLITDLPAGTWLHLRITRPSEGYLWTNFEERVRTVSIDSHEGVSGLEFIQTVENLDRSGLNKYRYWKGRWPGAIDGLPADRLIVQITLHALDHQFGPCNRALTGSQLDVRKNGHWIERQTELPSAIPSWLGDSLP